VARRTNQLINLCVNSLAEILNPLLHGFNQRADILPIVYLVRAVRN
jgi:hypothetical protein